MQEMINALGLRLDSTREVLILGLILARLAPLIFLAPFLGSQMIPSEIKMGLSACFAIIVWPFARESLTGPLPMHAWPVLLLMMKETMVGFSMGFASSHIFAAMEVAGRMIDTARGAAMAEVMLPSTRQRATIAGNIYQQLLVVFFVTLGGYRLFFEILLNSFQQIPLNGGIDNTPGYAPVVHFVCQTSAEIMYTGTILAAPAVAATFIVDIVFGMLNRVAPQLNAYFLAMPVKAMGALVLMLLGLPAVIQRFEIYMNTALVATEQAVELLKPR